MKLRIELATADITRIVRDELQRRIGDVELTPDNVKIEVKTEHNYKAEWETCQFRVSYEADIT